MLNPNVRSIYTSAFTPPSDKVLVEAVGASFSMDPEFLLLVPLHLSMITNEHEYEQDHIPLLKSLKMLSDRITFYCQQGQIQVPPKPNMLIGMLDKMIVEANAPNGGVFHPKFWILKFHDKNNPEDVLYRLMVLSRNLTRDRSWDVALTLDGHPTNRNFAYNRQLFELVSRLPDFAGKSIDRIKKKQTLRIADEIRKVDWELPEGYDKAIFHAIGLKNKPWVKSLQGSKCMAVISPFCKAGALDELALCTKKPVALISRPETLNIRENLGAYREFESCWTLKKNVEIEDGEDCSDDSPVDTRGLHAKVYVMEFGKDTHLYVGSANATNAAIVNSINLELLVELVGRRRNVGGVEVLLSEEGLGGSLVKFELPDEVVDELQDDASERQEAEDCLENARRIISKSGLKITCKQNRKSGKYRLELHGSIPQLEGIATARACLLTMKSDSKITNRNSIDLFQLTKRKKIELCEIDSSKVTGLLAVELKAEVFKIRVRFALNLPVNDLPENRDSAILQSVVKTPENFYRYLKLLLDTQRILSSIPNESGSESSNIWSFFASDGESLLENLIKAYCREKDSIYEVKELIDGLRTTENWENIIPKKFLETWEVFEEATKK